MHAIIIDLIVIEKFPLNGMDSGVLNKLLGYYPWLNILSTPG